jgi:secreted Zn-dependent insulinase-like peptidase
MHTLGSQSLTQISTKLERKRKGKRWIFNLSSTPTKGTHSLLEILAQIMGERKGRTLAHVLQVKEWWRELRKEGDLA